MTPEQIQLVRESWDDVAPLSSAVTAIFFDRLLVQYPHLRPLFAHVDMAELQPKLRSMLDTLVAKLDQLDLLAITLRDLGRRHEGYGVRVEDYHPVGATLLWALEIGLGETFTPPVRDAWAEAYVRFASAMTGGETFALR